MTQIPSKEVIEEILARELIRITSGEICAFAEIIVRRRTEGEFTILEGESRFRSYYSPKVKIWGFHCTMKII